jgi:hypothetical protein
MASVPEDTLHEVTEVAVIKHPGLGVLLLHSTDRRWHFPDSTVRVGQRWDESLRGAVRSATGIEDLTIGPILLIQNFGPGEVDDRPQFGLFFLCTTHTAEMAGTISYRWIKDPSELQGMELFHPLVADLIRRAQREDGPRRVGGLIPERGAQSCA